MLNRCYRKGNASFHKYGKKGIGVCEEWTTSFDSFLNWSLDSGYEDNLTLDRFDSTKDYSPDNCRWVDLNTQGQNKGVHKRNKLGILGVCPFGEKYRAYLQRDGKKKHLGVFETIDEAIKAREEAEKRYNDTGEI